MELYILRHGIAEDGHPGLPDSERALTPDGKKKLRVVARMAAHADVKPSLILTSPLKRALDTAQIAAEALGYKGDLLQTNALAPTSHPKSVWDEIRLHRDQSQILIVGHEPLSSRVTAFLLACPHLEIDFKKGAIARVDLEEFGSEPKGVLKWLLTPKLASR